MNKIYQKITWAHPQKNRAAGIGDCHAAAIASILNISLDQVPWNIRLVPLGEKWNVRRKKLDNWLRKEYGLLLIPIVANWYNINKFLDRRYTIGHLKFKGKASNHAVVCYSGKIVHDPFPYTKYKEYPPVYAGTPYHCGFNYFEVLSKITDRTLPYYGNSGMGGYIERKHDIQYGPKLSFYETIQ